MYHHLHRPPSSEIKRKSGMQKASSTAQLAANQCARVAHHQPFRCHTIRKTAGARPAFCRWPARVHRPPCRPKCRSASQARRRVSPGWARGHRESAKRQSPAGHGSASQAPSNYVVVGISGPSSLAASFVLRDSGAPCLPAQKKKKKRGAPCLPMIAHFVDQATPFGNLVHSSTHICGS